MKQSELEKYRAELLAERKAKREAVDAQYKRKLDAIDVLLEGAPKRPADPADAPEPTVKLSNPSVQIAVRDAIRESPERFTTAQLYAYIKSTYPSMKLKEAADLSNTIWVLKKNGEIELTQKSAGPHSPAVYRATATFRNAPVIVIE